MYIYSPASTRLEEFSVGRLKLLCSSVEVNISESTNRAPWDRREEGREQTVSDRRFYASVYFPRISRRESTVDGQRYIKYRRELSTGCSLREDYTCTRSSMKKLRVRGPPTRQLARSLRGSIIGPVEELIRGGFTRLCASVRRRRIQLHRV